MSLVSIINKHGLLCNVPEEMLQHYLDNGAKLAKDEKPKKS